MTTKALAPDVSTWPAEHPQLIGSHCGDCSATTWPQQSRCPRCSGPHMSEQLLPRRGTLVAWTTQGFVPKQPYAGNETAKTFKPFAFGLIQLGDVVRVEARLTENDPAKLVPGMELELTFVPFYTDEDGTDIVTWAFAPV
ncbi:Zn-ribbon domain-containing OB-fold protein [Rhodococcus chondri]|uniref:OB-fold domain-containing protein n=1 Tax=Rhodococcus chondri TaxID=3065941 RepID=A0ABU7JVJ7_9NOCA|nr:OB-fold domain-containing protein [Rhodococcus sp. CC-R104]MEE2033312.1 OB-fold domain-containing protein [Rhodococcus sp. CC-R104]